MSSAPSSSRSSPTVALRWIEMERALPGPGPNGPPGDARAAAVLCRSRRARDGRGVGIAGTLRTPGLDRGTRLARAGARHLSGRVVQLAVDGDALETSPRPGRTTVAEVREDRTSGVLWRLLVVLAAVVFVLAGLAV